MRQQHENLQILRTYSLLCLWGIVVGLIARNYQPASSPKASPYYASDTVASVLDTLGIMLVELGGLYFLLKPWHRPCSVMEPLIALVLFTPWTFLSSVAAMHASNSIFLHALWLWLVEAFLVVYTLYAFGLLLSRSSN